MGKYKYLAKNIGLLTLSSFATKLLSFFLVPLYTNELTTEEYGIYDFVNTTIGVLLPILTLNIQESVLRFTLDSKENLKKRNNIISVGIKYVICSNIIILLLLAVNYMLSIIGIVKDHTLFFFLMFFSQSVSGLLSSYARGIDHIKDISISSVITSIITIFLNILFLLVFKWGLKGYFAANIIGPIVQCVYLLISTRILCNLNLKEDSIEEKKSMLDYCRPLIANSISWWVNSASDRYIIIFFCGLGVNGIYSVASKIPSILNIFQSIFNQAWTLSVVKSYDSNDEDGFFTTTYSIYNAMLTILCSLLIVSDRMLAHYLYLKNFYSAWRYVPWLTMAILYGSLSGVLGGVFAAVKDSKYFAKSTVIGAIANILLNLILVPFFGAISAAIATTISYMIIWALRFKQTQKYIKLKINIKRDMFSYLLLIIQSVIILCVKGPYIYNIVLFLIIILLYVKDISTFISRFVLRRSNN